MKVFITHKIWQVVMTDRGIFNSCTLCLLLTIFLPFCYVKSATIQKHISGNSKQIAHQKNISSIPNTCNIQQPDGLQFNLHNKGVCAYLTVGTLVDPLSPKYTFNLNYQYYCNHYGLPYFKEHWNWGTTHLFKSAFDANVGQLVTSHKQCFDLSKSASRWIWRPCNTLAKTTNIKFDGDNPFNYLLIIYADGSQETIDQHGDEIHLKQPNGRVINFSYDNHMPINIVSGDGRQKIIIKYLQHYTDIASYQNGKQISHVQVTSLITRPSFILFDKNNISLQFVQTNRYLHSTRVNKFIYPAPAYLTQTLIYSCDRESADFIGNTCEIDKIILSRPGCSNIRTIG